MGSRSLWLAYSSIRRILAQSIVNSVLVMVGHVIADEPPQMGFIKRNDVIEKLPATASDPAFRDPVLPRCLNTGALRLQACRFQESNHISIEFGVAVEDA